MKICHAVIVISAEAGNACDDVLHARSDRHRNRAALDAGAMRSCDTYDDRSSDAYDRDGISAIDDERARPNR